MRLTVIQVGSIESWCFFDGGKSLIDRFKVLVKNRRGSVKNVEEEKQISAVSFFPPSRTGGTGSRPWPKEIY